MTSKSYLIIIVSLFFTLITSTSFAESWNTNKQGVVLDGYDVVAYHTQDKAIKGTSDFAVQHDGVMFHFVSQEHMDLFTKNPEQYTPKYNGYCAFAVGANNAKVPANADTFKIYNGELLVFFNDLYEGNKFNTKIPWNKDENSLYSKAESNWSQLK